MDKIRVLDPRTAQLIAAGEVVERPASVVKELVENSIDADASAITIEIENAGIDKIRIVDNGTGMSPVDAENCFVCHATSKVATAEDLCRIETLGFRGEALASVAAVSRVSLTTRERDADEGVHVTVEGGKILKKEQIGCPVGTVIAVSDLFFNTPVRKKFLKSEKSETAAISASVDRLALSHPKISFKYFLNGQDSLFTPGDGQLKSAIFAVLGKEISDTMLTVDYGTDIKVSGFVSKPLYCKGSRQLQYFFINSRCIQSKVIESALEAAYQGSIMKGRYPICVLNIVIDASSVDVNVHPTKSVVKFSKDSLIYNAVYAAVEKALSSEKQQYTAVPEPEKLDRSAQQKIVEGFFDRAAAQPKVEFEKKREYIYTPYEKETPKAAPLEFNDYTAIPKIVPVFEIETPAPIEREDTAIIGEVFQTYIIAQCGDEVYFIDKHAAHERMIYEKLKIEQSAPVSQPLLMPQNVPLSRQAKAAIMDHSADMEACGFRIEDFGANLLSVSAVPSVLENDDIGSALEQIGEEFLSGNMLADKRNRILEITACKAAVKAGQKNNAHELEALINGLMALPYIKYCPHGRPIVYTLTKKDFEHFFKRIV